MYNWEKSTREDKLRRNPRNPSLCSTVPSFSSTLLDDIFRSIDDGNEKFEESKPHREKIVKKQSNGGSAVKVARACNKINDEDTAKSRTPCFMPKPVRTRKSENWGNDNFSHCETNEHYVFDELPKSRGGETKHEDGLMKSKSRALKIYNNLKKIKQPISPGGRLTCFLNSLFANGTNAKKTKAASGGEEYETKSRRASSTCSSASSYTRSCLSKSSLKSKQSSSDGMKRTVRFYPVSVIVDEDCRPCGHKCIYYQDDMTQFGSLSKEEINLILMEKTRKIEEAARDTRRKDMMIRTKDAEEDDDASSDSSSDLFELDHLAFIKNKNARYCEELPVYETTHLNTNRAIADGLIV